MSTDPTITLKIPLSAIPRTTRLDLLSDLLKWEETDLTDIEARELLQELKIDWMFDLCTRVEAVRWARANPGKGIEAGIAYLKSLVTWPAGLEDPLDIRAYDKANEVQKVMLTILSFLSWRRAAQADWTPAAGKKWVKYLALTFIETAVTGEEFEELLSS